MQTAEIGGRTLWVIKEGEVFLASMISGLPSVELRARLESVLSEIQTVYRAVLSHFDGDKSTVIGVDEMLGQRLALEYKAAEASRIFFNQLLELAPKMEAALDSAANILVRLGELDGFVRMGVQLRLISNSDGVSTKRCNQWLRQQWVHFVRDALITRGSVPELLAADVDGSHRPSPVPILTLCRVGFSVALTAPDLPSCRP